MLLFFVQSVVPIFLLLLPLKSAAYSVQHDGRQNSDKLAVILVDGFRWDYFDTHKAHLPAFRRFLSEGARAEWLEPVFPSLSYANWHTLSTGLYPESHDILGNDMYDLYEGNPSLATFSLSDPNTTLHTKWWQKAEPIWTTATKHGKSSFLRNWSRCDVPFQGVLPPDCIGYGTENNVDDARNSIENVGTALAKGFDLVMVHVDFLDHAGHHGGPDSDELREALVALDGFLGSLLETLDEKRLSQKVNLLITSDHGMTYVGTGAGAKYIYLEDHVDMSQIRKTVSHGGVMQIAPVHGYLDNVYGSLSKVEGIRVFKRDEIPEHWHYKKGRCVHDLLLVAQKGYLLRLASVGGRKEPSGGTHGYYPEMSDMRGILFAGGPAFKAGYVGPRIKSVDVYQLYTTILGIPAQPHNGTWEHVSPLLLSPETSPTAEPYSAAIKISPVYMPLLIMYAILSCFMDH